MIIDAEVTDNALEGIDSGEGTIYLIQQ